MLDKKDVRLIKRYAVLPSVGVVALALAFVCPFLMIPFEMVADLVFHRQHYSAVPLYITIGVTVFNLVVFVYGILAPKIGMGGKHRGEHWRQLVARAQVQQAHEDRSVQAAAAVGLGAAGRLMSKSDNDAVSAAGGVAQVAAAAEAVDVVANEAAEMNANAAFVAEAYGVKIPKIGKWLVVYAIACVAIICVAYIPTLVQAHDDMQQTCAVVSERCAAIGAALEPVCARVEGADPIDEYSESGYHVSGYLNAEAGFGSIDRRVTVYLDKNGNIECVFYDEELDFCESAQAGKTMADYLAQAEADFATLSAALATADVPVEPKELFTTCAFGEEFKRKLLATDLYTEVDCTYETVGNVRLQQCFETEAKEEFGDDLDATSSRPTIELNVYPEK